jgi:formate dehydrogenase iron-sulfur subunit
VSGDGPLNIMLRGGDPATEAGHEDHPPRMGFFTDTSVCIGCKACEVACKEWNQVPEDGLNWAGRSHDNSGGLGADTWRSSSSARRSDSTSRTSSARTTASAG